MMVKKSRLKWFGHVEQDDNDWVKRCVTWEVEGIKDDAQKDLVGLC